MPNTNGKKYNKFAYSPRGYDSLKKWMLEVMGNTPLHEESQSITSPTTVTHVEEASPT
jgi:hypothetical protein